METPKQQAIKAAYGQWYEECKPDENGWSTNVTMETLFFTGRSEVVLFPSKYVEKWRPESLSGIENNRGWTRIESEEDMPKDKTIDVIINDECYQGYIYEGQGGLFCCVENRYNSTEISEIIEASYVTHYQPIIKPKTPIF